MACRSRLCSEHAVLLAVNAATQGTATGSSLGSGHEAMQDWNIVLPITAAPVCWPSIAMPPS